jgi:hypothetical protein
MARRECRAVEAMSKLGRSENDHEARQGQLSRCPGKQKGQTDVDTDPVRAVSHRLQQRPRSAGAHARSRSRPGARARYGRGNRAAGRAAQGDSDRRDIGRHRQPECAADPAGRSGPARRFAADPVRRSGYAVSVARGPDHRTPAARVTSCWDGMPASACVRIGHWFCCPLAPRSPADRHASRRQSRPWVSLRTTATRRCWGPTAVAPIHRNPSCARTATSRLFASCPSYQRSSVDGGLADRRQSRRHHLDRLRP